jgi:D-psicose/D-tagatose/L-ribulose 3-epimerase
LGICAIETAIEAPDGYCYVETGKVIKDHGLGVSLCAAPPPDGNLLCDDEQIRAGGRAFIKHCIEAAHALGATNLAGPLCAAVGRTWKQTPDERARFID